MKFADGKTSSANVPHLNVWGFYISAAEFPQQKKRASFGVNRPLVMEYCSRHSELFDVMTNVLKS